MATFPNSYVPINAHTNARVNSIVDNLLTPTILNFRQITIYNEQAKQVGPASWQLTYPTWNDAFPVKTYYNGQEITPASIDYILGSVTFTNAAVDGDNVNVTYNIDWFPVGILAGFIFRAIDIINGSGTTTATEYDINSAPSHWDGVITDLVVAMCMEKLILDYDLWHGRLIFALGANELDEGGGDIVGQLETIKSNAEERARLVLDNEKFKIGNLLSAPTSIYYAAIRGMGRLTGSHGVQGGKIRGWRNNRYI